MEGIVGGVDFVELIQQQLRGCRVLLALIDPDGVTAADSKGRRRLDLPNDYVRIEVSTALRRRIRVVPILIDGAEMPEEEALPDDLEGLARRNALELDFKRFDAEAGRLVAAVRRILETPEPGPGAPAPGATAAGGCPRGHPGRGRIEAALRGQSRGTTQGRLACACAHPAGVGAKALSE